MKGEFTLSSTAWPRDIWITNETKLLIDELLITIFEPRHGEFKLQFLDLGMEKPAVKMEVFDDAWLPLHQSGLLPHLSDLGINPTVEYILAMLTDLGYVPSQYHNQMELERKTGLH